MLHEKVVNLEISSLVKFWDPEEPFVASLKKMFYLALRDSLCPGISTAFDIALKAAVVQACDEDKQWLLIEKQNLNKLSAAMKSSKAIKDLDVSHTRGYTLIDLWSAELARFRKEEKGKENA